jgi:hypothetical protein
MFKLAATERLSRWREFRKSLDTLSLEQAVKATVDFWHGCPFSPYYLDPAKPEEWPNPWTLIEENYYCDIAKALGMLYTIKFTTHNPSVELRMYVDPETRYSYNLVWIDDGKYVINLIEGEVVNKQLADNLTLKVKYADELNLNSY